MPYKIQTHTSQGKRKTKQLGPYWAKVYMKRNAQH